MKLCQYLLRSQRLRGSLVGILLAFAFFDLAIVDTCFPQLCNDEQEMHFFASPIESATTATDEPGAIANHDQQPTHDSIPTPSDEDCFCCCSHIVLGYAIGAVTSSAPPGIGLPMDDILPSPPPQDTYRPPRFV